MDRQHVHQVFAYDAWANRRLLEAAAKLTPAEFTRELGASFGSIRGTLLHIMWGEKRALHRWRTGSPLNDPNVDDFPTAEAIRSAWSHLEQDRMAFADTLSDESLAARVSVRGSDFELQELIHHVTNHSTYHRGQIALLLRQVGQTPPSTDFAFFLLDTRNALSN